MPATKKALLFDLDGTLAETDSVHFPTWASILALHGHDITWEFYRERISGRLDSEILAEFVPGLSPEEARAVVEAKEADFRERAGSLEPMPGLLGFVEVAREAGLGMALVTNAPRENAFAVARAVGLHGSFDPVVLAEDVGVGKPDPALYLAALDALRLTPQETVAFEDSPTGIASSVAAGIPTVGVASTHDPEKLEALGVEIVVRDFTDPRLGAFIGRS